MPDGDRARAQTRQSDEGAAGRRLPGDGALSRVVLPSSAARTRGRIGRERGAAPSNGPRARRRIRSSRAAARAARLSLGQGTLIPLTKIPFGMEKRMAPGTAHRVAGTRVADQPGQVVRLGPGHVELALEEVDHVAHGAARGLFHGHAPATGHELGGTLDHRTRKRLPLEHSYAQGDQRLDLEAGGRGLAVADDRMGVAEREERTRPRTPAGRRCCRRRRPCGPCSRRGRPCRGWTRAPRPGPRPACRASAAPGCARRCDRRSRRSRPRRSW